DPLMDHSGMRRQVSPEPVRVAGVEEIHRPAEGGVLDPLVVWTILVGAHARKATTTPEAGYRSPDCAKLPPHDPTHPIRSRPRRPRADPPLSAAHAATLLRGARRGDRRRDSRPGQARERPADERLQDPQRALR